MRTEPFSQNQLDIYNPLVIIIRNMGNSMNQIKNSLAESFSKKTNGNSQIGKTLNCPNCGRLFNSKTTYNSLNAHLDSCLANQQNVQEPPVQQLQQTNPFQLQNPFAQKQYQSLGADYYWVKVIKDGSYTWERRIITNLQEFSVAQLTHDKVIALSFPEKQLWLKQELNKLRIPWQMGADHLKIQMNNILLSSLATIGKVNMHKEVKVDFLGDKVQDAGGLLREWLLLLFKDLTHPNLGLFVLAETEDVCYRINPDLQADEHLKNCLKLCGKAIGKAVFERFSDITYPRLTLNIFFDRPFIKSLIGQEIVLDDIKMFDKQLYNSWKYLLENTFNPDELLEYFVICRNRECIELKPDGCETMVTNENKQEYVQLCIKFVTQEFIKPSLGIILEEIYKIVPAHCWKVLTVEEAEMILYGVPFIDLEEWKEHTEYGPGISADHKTVKWFWEVLHEFDQEQLSKFLQFCTGSQRIPVSGFSKLESNRGAYAKFRIVTIKFDDHNPFPKAHTCFNRLELPAYPSLIITRKFLKAIVLNDLEGVFGME